jgi:hypothetical protein
MKIVVYRKNLFWRVKLVSTNGKNHAGERDVLQPL